MPSFHKAIEKIKQTFPDLCAKLTDRCQCPIRIVPCVYERNESRLSFPFQIFFEESNWSLTAYIEEELNESISMYIIPNYKGVPILAGLVSLVSKRPDFLQTTIDYILQKWWISVTSDIYKDTKSTLIKDKYRREK